MPSKMVYVATRISIYTSCHLHVRLMYASTFYALFIASWSCTCVNVFAKQAQEVGALVDALFSNSLSSVFTRITLHTEINWILPIQICRVPWLPASPRCVESEPKYTRSERGRWRTREQAGDCLPFPVTVSYLSFAEICGCARYN